MVNSIGKNVLSHCTWGEISEIKREDQIVLILLGSNEQQGAHLALGLDTFVAERVALHVAQRTGALVAPTIPLGYSQWFMEYPGTLSLSMETLIQLIREYGESLMVHGFRRFLFINGHSGNSPAVDILAREWKLRFDLTLAMVEIWKIANALAKKCEHLQEKFFKHGGEVMTSIAMEINPELVEMSRAKPEYLKSSNPGIEIKSTLGVAEFDGIEVSFYEKAKRCTETGIMGNPMAANLEAGKWLLREIESYVERLIRNF
jgi:creatinine amidohydrolase